MKRWAVKFTMATGQTGVGAVNGLDRADARERFRRLWPTHQGPVPRFWLSPSRSKSKIRGHRRKQRALARAWEQFSQRAPMTWDVRRALIREAMALAPDASEDATKEAGNG